MRWALRSWTVCAAALVAVGCTGHRSPSGELVGTFRVTVGPSPSPFVLSPIGTITVHSNTAAGAVVATTKTTSKGSFRVAVPAGRYLLIGQSQSTAQTCQADEPVTVASGGSARVNLDCQGP